VLGLLALGLVIWLAWPKKKPAVADAGPARDLVPAATAASVPAAPQPPPWKAKEDPPGLVEFPAEGIPLGQQANWANQPGLPGSRHAYFLAMPKDDPAAKLPIYRVVDLLTGKVVCDVPQEHLNRGSAISDDSKRLAALIDETPRGAPRGQGVAAFKVYDLPALTLKKSVSVWNPRWYDFGKDSDTLLAAVGDQRSSSIVYADLKAEAPAFKPVPLTRPAARPGGVAAVSPGRSYLAVHGERHVELVNLADWTSAGIVEVPGTVVRAAFSADGKDVTIWSMRKPDRIITAADREQTQVQWTTFAMADGRELRKVETTSAIDTDPQGFLRRAGRRLDRLDRAQPGVRVRPPAGCAD
jgi:hypothetical protein